MRVRARALGCVKATSRGTLSDDVRRLSAWFFTPRTPLETCRLLRGFGLRMSPYNKLARANRRYASPLGVGRQFGLAFHAQPFSTAAVAAVLRSCRQAKCGPAQPPQRCGA